jgi:hypothetical protein
MKNFLLLVLFMASPTHFCFVLPAAAETQPTVVSPDTKTVAPLVEIKQTPFEFVPQPGGGFVVKQQGQEYRLESAYSYPHGGDNRLTAGAADAQGEANWKVTTEKLDDKNYCVRAAGKFYSLDRRIELQPTRVMIKDTLTNTGDDAVGIIIDNHVNIAGQEKELQPKMMNKLTAFVHGARGGLGVIAMDDLYQYQEKPRSADGLVSLRDEHFGLDKKASYTVEWAVYPTASGDYYDFINQVREDEGLNRRVEGSWSFVDRREPPKKEFMDLFSLKYTCLPCLGNPPDDPDVSLEGVEFTEYPEECRLIKNTLAETKRLYPDVKAMFHVAHGLYACGDPEKRFGDSRVLRADGRQIMYGGDSWDYYARYMSKERFDEGWRWHIFYPTLENSFGKAMIQAAHYMVDVLGVTGMFADGFLSGYAYVDGNDGGYSYDRWDGHSVDIDPKTKLITRKKTCVPWVSLPVLKEVVRIIRAAGGVVITNEGPDYVTPRSFWKEDTIASCEGSPDAVIGLHLGRGPCSLSSPAADAEGSYLDILKKLDDGSLYFMYEHKLDRKTLLEHMYPITIESIHSGTIRGKERIITKNSGVFGRPGDRRLHLVYGYDSRGFPAKNDFWGTSDRSSVRTELRLKKDESAAVVFIPVQIDAAMPVNFSVRRYGDDGFEAVLNGKGQVQLSMTTGPFVIKPGKTYRVTTTESREVAAGDDASLEFPLTLDGPVTLRITMAATNE